MKKNIFMILAAAAIFASCSNNDVVEPNQPAGEAMIQLRSAHKVLNADAASTRAPFLGTISETNPLTAIVVSAEGADADAVTGDYLDKLHANGTMTFIGGSNASAYNAASLSDAAQMKFPSQNKLFLTGLYPTTGWTTLTATGSSIAFTGKEDVMVAKEVATTEAEVIAGTHATLAFEHLLTKLEVSLKSDKSSAAGVWGKVTKIELIKTLTAVPANVVAVTFADGATALSGSAVFPFYVMSKDADTGALSYSETVFAEQPITTTETIAAYSIVAPFEAVGTDDLTFKVYTENVPAGTEVKVSLKDTSGLSAFTGATAGRAFSIVFNFGVDDKLIEGQATVTDWIFSGKTEAPVIKQ